jgi:hypothetical protein
MSVILEFGGASAFYSVNAEYAIVQEEKYQVNLRAGVGYFPEEFTTFYSVPVGGNLVYKLKKRHHLETGIGFSYLHGFPAHSGKLGGDRISFEGEGIYFSPSIGYRYDKWESGLILRIAYSPLIVLHDFVDRNEMEARWEKELGVPYEGWEDIVELPVAENRFGYFSVSVGYRF